MRTLKPNYPVKCTGAAFAIVRKTIYMKAVGIVLIIVGIAMLVFRGFSVQTEKEVVDLGPLEVNKKENKWFTWPVYTGAIAIVAGIIVVASARKSA